PVDRGIEVGADVLARREGVPVPRRAPLVVPAELLQREPRGVREGGGALGGPPRPRQRCRQVDDLDPTLSDAVEQVLQSTHRHAPPWDGGSVAGGGVTGGVRGGGGGRGAQRPPPG